MSADARAEQIAEDQGVDVRLVKVGLTAGGTERIQASAGGSGVEGDKSLSEWGDGFPLRSRFRCNKKCCARTSGSGEWFL